MKKTTEMNARGMCAVYGVTITPTYGVDRDIPVYHTFWARGGETYITTQPNTSAGWARVVLVMGGFAAARQAARDERNRACGQGAGARG